MDSHGRAARFPAALDAVAQRVETRVLRLLDDELVRWSAIDAALAAPLRSLHALVVAGGKRLRPVFVHCAHVGAGGDPDALLAIDAAAAIELVHTFALIHDDVMDGSDRRRGRDAVHREFAMHHVAHDWRGEPRRFGDGIAILVGDFAFVYADQLMRDAPDDARSVYDELRVELCVGQSLDLIGAARADTDVDAAARIVTYKSAKYTVERPLHLGAAIAGRLDELAAPLSAIGLPLGEAFQLRDDVLGVFGDEAVTGKPVGDDLREGKPTPLVAVAASRIAPSDRPLLDRIGATELEDTEVKALQELFVRTGALDAIEAQIARKVSEAHAAIAAAGLTRAATDELDELADYVAWRDR
ncbi:MAG TPA: polyprenyl synthetase family protein [Acidimicrobiia bacterium]|nr:polyprenyl synthetase family protein [Acidimicrobiia bacterium]